MEGKCAVGCMDVYIYMHIEESSNALATLLLALSVLPLSSYSQRENDMTEQPIFSIFTHSVGAHTAGHTLPAKLRAIAKAGLQAVEIFQDDLDAFVQSQEFQNVYKCQTPPDSPNHLHALLSQENNNASASSSSSVVNAAPAAVAGSKEEEKEEKKTAWNAHGPCTLTDAAKELFAASYIAQLCTSLGLRIATLQPMRDVEGWASPEDRRAALNRVKSRFPVMRALGTDLLMCCSNNQHAPATTGDVDRIVEDFVELAREASHYDEVVSPPCQLPSIRIGFEALSWGAHIDHWKQAWEVVQKVDMPNFGLVLDSFNMLGREFADPCTPSGIQEPIPETIQRVDASIDALRDIPGDKIFFLQVADARKMPAPLAPSPNATEPRPSRMIWSRGNRLMPGEVSLGAFLPVVPFVKAAVLGAGYKGPISIETFNTSLNDEGDNVPEEHAQRAIKGLTWLHQQVHA